MPWFLKRETFLRPYTELRPHLQAHRAWVQAQRQRGLSLSSGYLVDGEGKPGGGGVLLLEAEDFASAEALIHQDPMVISGLVDWSLHQWISAVGELEVG
ncbi:MAG: YciI family protein [Sphaerospermopsis kisseleviana]